MKRRPRTWTFALLLVSLIGLAAFYILTDRNDAKPPMTDRAADNAESGNHANSGAGEQPDDAMPDDGAASDEAADNDAAGDGLQEPLEPEPEPPAEGELIAVGDVMMHMPQLPAYYDKERDVYDFSPYFTEVTPILSQGDWVMANLETTLNADGDYTGYPMFSAPSELASSLSGAGFNIITTSNNHSLDRGAKGVERTLGILEEQGLIAKGTARSAEEAAQPTIVERAGIKLGLLAYTYGTNGIPIPKDRPYLVALMDEPKMLEDIQALREAGADYITVALHFGNEYQPMPSEAQKTIARKLIAGGADLIAGSHPHVIQPYETVEAVDDDDGPARRGIIIYSMGNFISNQRGDTKDYGIIYRIKLRKENGITQPIDIEPIITWVHRYKEQGRNRYRILPVEQTLDKRDDALLTASDYKQLETTLVRLKERLSAMAAPTP